MCRSETSAGSHAHTASTTPFISERPCLVRRLRRTHVSNVCASQAAARRASHGAAVGTLRAIRSSRNAACPKSASACGASFGMRARVAPHLAVDLDQVLAVAEGRERLDAELARERREPVLGRPDPLAARLDDLAAADLLVERAPADAVARLEHHHALAGAGQVARGDEAREPGADDDYVDFIGVAYHRRMPQHEPDNRKREF